MCKIISTLFPFGSSVSSWYMIKKKNLAYHLINHGFSFSILLYAHTNLSWREISLQGNRTAIRTISRCQLKWGLSKENNSILEVGLLKQNKGNKVKYPYMLLFPFIYN